MTPALPSRKEETRERIVRTAARAIRRRGYDGVGVAEIMGEAGLTHGGFYAHFPSKAALLAEAADRAGAEGVESLSRAAGRAPAGEGLMALVDSYLSEAHIRTAEPVCPVASLGSETPRQPPEVRRAATHRLKELVGVVERQMPGWGEPGNHEKALAILSAMVGALVMARAVDEPALAAAIRNAARAAIGQLAD